MKCLASHRSEATPSTRGSSVSAGGMGWYVTFPSPPQANAGAYRPHSKALYRNTGRTHNTRALGLGKTLATKGYMVYPPMRRRSAIPIRGRAWGHPFDPRWRANRRRIRPHNAGSFSTVQQQVSASAHTHAPQIIQPRGGTARPRVEAHGWGNNGILRDPFTRDGHGSAAQVRGHYYLLGVCHARYARIGLRSRS